MTPQHLIDLSTTIALIVLAAALLLSVVRIMVGPKLADRILALDLLTVVAMGFVGAIAIRTGLSLYLDIALALGLVSFVATVSLTRYMLSRRSSRRPPS